MKRSKTFLIKVFSVLSLLMTIIIISYFIIYPNLNQITLYKNSLVADEISHNVSLNFLTSISPISSAEYSKDFDQAGSVEFISQEELAKYRNEGRVLFNLEKNGTSISIPSVKIYAAIQDGETAHAMDEGPWHFPLSVSPGEKGNFVIFGHRFAELPPSTNTFFNLDKVKVGDKLYIEQEGETIYTYTVINSEVVEKNNRAILQPGNGYKITLVTCTPLWTSKQRLVVTGILDKVYRKI